MSSVVARKFQLLRDKRAKGELRLYCGRGCFRQSLGPVTDTHVLSTCLNCLNISQFVCKQFIPLATSGSPLQPRALPGVTDSQSIVYNTGLTLQWHRSHQNFCSTYSVSLDVLFMCVWDAFRWCCYCSVDVIWLLLIQKLLTFLYDMRRNVKRALCKFYIYKFITYISVLYKLDFDDTV